MEFVDLLKNPDKYKELGAKPPKGAILLGKQTVLIKKKSDPKPFFIKFKIVFWRELLTKVN